MPQTGEISPRRLLPEIKLVDQNDLIDILLSTNKRFDFFTGDTDDEFTIKRENSELQGIFKVWAPHIIPFLEKGINKGINVVEEWRQDLETKPLSLHESLEQWRAFSAIFDQRLQKVFSSREIPSDPENAVVELFLRIKIAFALAAPFYNIEALVADSRQNRIGNPINVTETITGGGKLDAVALMLPSALADQVSAEKLNWNNLTWEEIHNRVDLMRNDFLKERGSVLTDQFVLISKIASMSGVGPEEILFAANALQFIPVDVGGKKEDMPQVKAIEALTEILKEQAVNINTNLVAKDINALIRFLNWLPAIKSAENFRGKFWMYDAVCATANELLKTINYNSLTFFDGEFSDIFLKLLSPQLDGIDATSAKGRFLLQLLAEGKFSIHISKAIGEKLGIFTKEIMLSLDRFKQEEMVIDIWQQMPTFLVGGKANGLRRAMEIFGPEAVLGGKIITSETINEWLMQTGGLGALIQSLETSSNNTEDRVKIGEEIKKRITSAQIPMELIDRIKKLFVVGQKIVLRSSSFDEDVPLIGPAPGIYESVIDINSNDDQSISNALKIVIASIFSEKAISFRDLKGLRHKPIFAVLVQEFIDNTGGSVFVNNGDIRLNVAQQPSMVNPQNEEFEELFISNKHKGLVVECKLLTTKQIREIVSMAQKTEKIWGNSDIEFVVDPKSNRIKILQLRSLQQKEGWKSRGVLLNTTDKTVIIDTLDRLPDIGNTPINIQINSGIDLEKFQGTLFRWLLRNTQRIVSITLEKRIPTTCHFANIIGILGIKLFFKDIHER